MSSVTICSIDRLNDNQDPHPHNTQLKSTEILNGLYTLSQYTTIPFRECIITGDNNKIPISIEYNEVYFYCQCRSNNWYHSWRHYSYIRRLYDRFFYKKKVIKVVAEIEPGKYVEANQLRDAIQFALDKATEGRCKVEIKLNSDISPVCRQTNIGNKFVFLTDSLYYDVHFLFASMQGTAEKILGIEKANVHIGELYTARYPYIVQPPSPLFIYIDGLGSISYGNDNNKAAYNFPVDLNKSPVVEFRKKDKYIKAYIVTGSNLIIQTPDEFTIVLDKVEDVSTVINKATNELVEIIGIHDKELMDNLASSLIDRFTIIKGMQSEDDKKHAIRKVINYLTESTGCA